MLHCTQRRLQGPRRGPARVAKNRADKTRQEGNIMAVSNEAAARTEDTIDNVRDFAKKGVDEAQNVAAQAKSAAFDAANQFQDVVTKNAKGFQELSLKTLEISRSNLNAHFDFVDSLLKAKTFGEALELQSAYTRAQAEALAAQSKELATIAQKAVTENSKTFQDFGGKVVRGARPAR